MYRLKIEHDQDAQNPREDHDNADIMYCEHRRYSLGDKDAEHPYNEVACVTLTSPAGTAYMLDDSETTDGSNLILDDVLAMCEEHAEEAAADAEDNPESQQAAEDAARAELACRYLRSATWETEYRLRPGIALCRPLYLYDHGGITISAGSFSCPWDSGQVGWQYLTDKALADEWNGDRDRALAYMDATLNTYDEYIQGNVHGFVLEKGTPTKVTTEYPDGTTSVHDEIEWDDEDSCWGFIGDWWMKGDPTGMREHLPREVEALFDSMDYSDVGEWRYTADVPEELRHD